MSGRPDATGLARHLDGSRPGVSRPDPTPASTWGESAMSEPMASCIVVRGQLRRSNKVTALGVLLLLLGLFGAFPSGHADAAAPFSPGDIVVGIGSSPNGGPQGKLLHFSPAGVLLDTLLTTSGSFEETGACFDSSRNLYTTNFEANSVSKFGASGTLLQASFASFGNLASSF